MKVSIVIPVYNEADYLPACLDAIAAQTVAPFEVIVVDNNSSDETLALARQYDFIKLIHESRQGIVHARNAGFTAAMGEIIARIDADTHLPADWVEKVVQMFELRPNTTAITGAPRFYDIRGARLANKGQVFAYQTLQKMLTGTFILWGANMAIRREAWQKVATVTSRRTDVDEDIDLSLCMHKLGLRIDYVPSLTVGASFQRGRLSPTHTFKYLSSWPRDFALHHMYLRALFIGLLITLGLIVAAPFLWLATFKQNLTHSRLDR